MRGIRAIGLPAATFPPAGGMEITGDVVVAGAAATVGGAAIPGLGETDADDPGAGAGLDEPV
ncbi:MAG: hypothetical protein V4662_17510 [Verrucomicrobiota bacterium]